MSSFPSGTVTFLFTDIEGSTKLAQQYPEEMPALLARHNEILTRAIEAHHGFVFQIVGDSFSAAFHNAGDALNAVLDAQRALHREAWSPAPVKVRMGIHTGAAQWKAESSDPRYSGYATVALAERVMSAGHGGQILISQAAYDLLIGNLPVHVQFIDMGEYHLKDILRPQHLYQLTVPDLPAEFPALRTLIRRNHNLPVNLTSFIGRARELAETKERLAGARLLTLTGPGGTGKTRLSIELGGEVLSAFGDGVWLIELAPLADPALMIQTIAAVFGLRENPGRPLVDQVTDYLRARQLLLILDNCEHLVEACAKLAEALLHTCPHLKILASSREPLGIPGETTYRVPSLYLPDQTQVTPEAILGCEAVQLFVDRACAAHPDFRITDRNAPYVAQICRRLDGIPLALELAAARTRVLSPEQIASRLDDRFRLLTGGSRTALPRQQTLRALIDWSYDLLTGPEKALFRRLAVFVGGWTLDAAEEVCAGNGIEQYEVLDLLTQLVDKSLVIANAQDGTVRYHRLETIHQYAREKLFESDEAFHVRQCHLDYFIKLVRWGGENWFGPASQKVEARLGAEGDNIRSALSWTLENRPEEAMKLISWVTLMGLWIMRGQITEARSWCETALARLETLSPETEPALRNLVRMKAKGWNYLAMAQMNLGDHHASRDAAEKSVKLAREVGDRRILAQALASLGIGAAYTGDTDYALEVTGESLELCRQGGYRRTLAWAINTMIHIYGIKGDPVQKQNYENQYKSLRQEAGLPFDPAESAMVLSEQAYRRGDYAEALQHVESALSNLAERGDKYRLTGFQSEVAHFLRQQGRYTEALRFYRRSIRLWQDFGHRGAVAHQLECFAYISIAQDQSPRAVRLLSAAEALRGVSDSVRTPIEQKEFEEATSRLRTQMDPA
ncbi:MAG TPA: adenylate/guanylate cyclase domain-containing protein, partial [Anaerolineales bacterium]|nr:adenylate/guanylate cyclase domain-containing protein [Anaerolineales bacterium]